MSHAMMLQDWITLSGTASTMIQDVGGWLDVSGYQGACVYFQLAGNNNATSSIVSIQTAPARDETFFAAAGTGNPAIAQFTTSSGTTLGVQPLLISRWATEPAQPLSRYLRWACAFGAGNTTITFRVWVTLLQSAQSTG